MNENKLAIKTVEWIFAIVVLLVCTIVLGKYAILSATGHDISYNLEMAVVRARNTDSRVQRKSTTKIYSLTKVGNKWTLLEDNYVAKDYEVINSDGMVAIQRNNASSEASELVFIIDGVRDYFTRDEVILTDIPYDSATDTFFVPEQEDLFPIIGYHNVFKSEDEMRDPFIDIRKSDFEEQLDIYNNQLNCRWFGLSDVVQNYLSKSKKLPSNTCVMTFDDGRKNNYEVVLPILKQKNISATFFVIAGRFGQKSYMTNWEVSSLFRAGNEINSHSFTGGSLVDTSWYTGDFTQETLINQITGAKEILNSYGYDANVFAYPLGEYDDNVLSVVKNSGYIGARATKKSSPWRDPRALATSIENDFIWHLNYYQPELKYNDQIIKDLAYDGWWQFEEGSRISGETAYTLSTVKPTEKSHGVVYLEDIWDTVENSFILANSGTHILDILVSNNGVDGLGFTIEIDGKRQSFVKDITQTCIAIKSEKYCHYIVQTNMAEGKHSLKIINDDGRTGLDKFQIKRIVPFQNSYQVRLEEIL